MKMLLKPYRPTFTTTAFRVLMGSTKDMRAVWGDIN